MKCPVVVRSPIGNASAHHTLTHSPGLRLVRVWHAAPPMLQYHDGQPPNRRVSSTCDTQRRRCAAMPRWDAARLDAQRSW